MAFSKPFLFSISSYNILVYLSIILSRVNASIGVLGGVYLNTLRSCVITIPNSYPRAPATTKSEPVGYIFVG